MTDHVAMHDRYHVLPRTQRHDHRRRSRLVAYAGGHGPLGVSLFEKFFHPLVQVPRQIHKRISRGIEFRLRQMLRPARRRMSGPRAASTLHADNCASSVSIHAAPSRPAVKVIPADDLFVS